MPKSRITRPFIAGSSLPTCSRSASIHRSGPKPYYGGMVNGPIWVAQPWQAAKVPETEVDELLAKLEPTTHGLHAIVYPSENPSLIGGEASDSATSSKLLAENETD